MRFRAYHTVGDEMFMNAFETGSLPFEQWTHRAHIRMAYNYILRYGRDRAVPFIRFVLCYMSYTEFVTIC